MSKLQFRSLLISGVALTVLCQPFGALIGVQSSSQLYYSSFEKQPDRYEPDVITQYEIDPPRQPSETEPVIFYSSFDNGSKTRQNSSTISYENDNEISSNTPMVGKKGALFPQIGRERVSAKSPVVDPKKFEELVKEIIKENSEEPKASEQIASNELVDIKTPISPDPLPKPEDPIIQKPPKPSDKAAAVVYNPATTSNLQEERLSNEPKMDEVKVEPEEQKTPATTVSSPILPRSVLEKFSQLPESTPEEVQTPVSIEPSAPTKIEEPVTVPQIEEKKFEPEVNIIAPPVEAPQVISPEVLEQVEPFTQPAPEEIVPTVSELPAPDQVVVPVSVPEQVVVPTPQIQVMEPAAPLTAPESATLRQITPVPQPSRPAATSQQVVQPSAPATPELIDQMPAIDPGLREITVNFTNVGIIEAIRFMGKVANKNFIFDEEELQFNVTIISEEPTSIDNLMAALLQEIKIRNLSLIEQGNNIIIHGNPRIKSPAHIVAEGLPNNMRDAEIVTRVFRLNTLDPVKASEVIKPLLSDDALVQVVPSSNNIIITDITRIVDKVGQLIKALDAPMNGMTVGQYAVQNSAIDVLIDAATRILDPIAQGNPYVLIPHGNSNSIFIVSNPFLVNRSIAILESLDTNQGVTQILSLDQLKAKLEGKKKPRSELEGGLEGAASAIFRGAGGPGTEGGIGVNQQRSNLLPAGHIERTLFFIHKLKYRRGDQIETALRKIAFSLDATSSTNTDLISAINSIQWIESSNSLIFTGIASALEKVKELIEEIDMPLRQVFVEVLILDTTLHDSLSYGVDWGSRFGGAGTAGSEGFFSGSSPLVGSLDTASTVPGLNGTGAVAEAVANANVTLPDPTNLVRNFGGFGLGVIGHHLTHGGTVFNSIGALVTAIKNDTTANILLNPKILTEDNNPATVFVGSTTRYKTQSISNDQGNVITNNFQFLDVGTTLTVTPLISNTGIITMTIVEEVTTTSAGANTTPSNTANVDINLVPVLSKSKTETKIHVPSGYFVIMSGMIQDVDSKTEDRVPCLGGIPLLGAANKRKSLVDDKRNTMFFIRPVIIDTDVEMEELTKRQQDAYREKSRLRKAFNYEIDEALDFFNIRSSDADDYDCD